MKVKDKFLELSLKNQFFLGAIVIISVLIFALSFLNLKRQVRFLENSLRSEAIQFSEVLALNSSNLMLSIDIAGLNEIVRHISKNEKVSYVFIHDLTGKVLAHTDPDIIGKYLKDIGGDGYKKSLSAEAQLTFENQNLIDYVYPIKSNDSILGWVRIGLTKKFINQEYEEFFVKTTFFAVFFVLVSYIFISFVLTKLLEDVNDLSYVALQIEKGNKSIRTQVKSSNEIGQLARVFNSMLDKLHQSEERLDLALKGSRDGLWDWYVKTGKTYYSPRWLEILGYTEVEASESKNLWMDSVHPEDLARAVKALNDHIEGRADNYECEHRLKHKDGHYIWTVGRGIGVKDDKGEIYRIVGTQTDITIQKKAELEKEQIFNQLRQSQKMEAIGQLTGGIAHDFNNILTGIIGFTDLGIKKTLNDEKLTGYLVHILKLSNRAKELVRQMLIYSRGGDPIPVVINLSDVLAENLKLLAPMMTGNIHLKINHLDSNLKIKIDPVQMQQIIMNLAINARDAFNDQKGEIEFSLNVTNTINHTCSSCGEHLNGKHRWVALTVKDNGPGMNESTLKKIFEPFYTTKAPGKGTGMGLSMVHGIVHRHNGHIVVNSIEGKGCEFVILFEESTEAVSSINEAKTVVITDNQLKKRVLIVDDEEFIRQYLKDILDEMNCEVLEAENGKKGLESVLRNPHSFDLIITDYTMPELNGIEMIQAIRKELPYLPIILSSGNIDVALDKNYKDLRIDGVLLKPFEIDDAINLVQSLLKTSEKIN